MQLKQSFLAFTLVAAVVSCSDDNNASATMTVANQSDFAIEQIFLTDVNNPDFGRNLIAGTVLLPGEQLTLGVPCGRFDALLVDETGTECTLNDINLCFNNAEWVLTNNTCTVFAARAAADKAAAETPVDTRK